MEQSFIINLGPLEDIPIGQGRCFIVKDEEVSVFHLRSGKVRAVENKCPHRQGPLSEGIIDEGKVVCPLHGHKFDLKTGRGSEGGECVRVFESWIEHNHVYIEYLCHPNVKESLNV